MEQGKKYRMERTDPFCQETDWRDWNEPGIFGGN